MRNDKTKIADSVLDIRVRERLMAAGTLDPKVVEQYIAELPDLESQVETVELDQPALAPQDLE